MLFTMPLYEKHVLHRMLTNKYVLKYNLDFNILV